MGAGSGRPRPRHGLCAAATAHAGGSGDCFRARRFPRTQRPPRRPTRARSCVRHRRAGTRSTVARNGRRSAPSRAPHGVGSVDARRDEPRTDSRRVPRRRVPVRSGRHNDDAEGIAGRVTSNAFTRLRHRTRRNYGRAVIRRCTRSRPRQLAHRFAGGHVRG